MSATKIEYWLDDESPKYTGWYINEYEEGLLTDSAGPYETKTEAMRMWRDTTPSSAQMKEPEVGSDG